MSDRLLVGMVLACAGFLGIAELVRRSDRDSPGLAGATIVALLGAVALAS